MKRSRLKALLAAAPLAAVVLGSGLASGPVAAATAPTAARAAAGRDWSAARAVPGLNALARFSYAGTPGCGTAGNCATGGGYYQANGDAQAWVAAEVHGTWQAAREAPGVAALNKGGSATISAISCPSPGSCLAIGTAATASGGSVAFALSESAGKWERARSLTASPPAGAGWSADSLSCPTAGSCTAAITYSTASGRGQAYVMTRSRGSWGAPKPVPGLRALDKGGVVFINLSCAAPGSCAAGGSYSASTYATQAFVATETKGKWGNAIEVPGTAALNRGKQGSVNALSCGAAGECAAVGSYTNASHYSGAFVVAEVHGHWRTAKRVSGTTGLPSLAVVSCPATGACTAGGEDGKGAILVSEQGGTWGRARHLTGLLPGMTSVDSVDCWSAGNCAAAGFSHKGAPVNGGNTEVFVIDQANGTWGPTHVLAGTVHADRGGDMESAYLACAPGGGCAVSGQRLAFNSRYGTYHVPYLASETPPVKSATALSLSAAKVTYGKENAERIRVTVTAPGVTPAGRVTVAHGKSIVCVIKLRSGKGTCRLAARQLKPGNYKLTARYPGTPHLTASTSPARKLTVKR